MEFSLPDNLQKWPPEDDRGPIEYKSMLPKIVGEQKWNRLITQMKWRMLECADLFDTYETIYVLGVHDNGEVAELGYPELEQTIRVVERVTKVCKANIGKLTRIDTGKGLIAIMHIKAVAQPEKCYPVFSQT